MSHLFLSGSVFFSDLFSSLSLSYRLISWFMIWVLVLSVFKFRFWSVSCFSLVVPVITSSVPPLSVPALPTLTWASLFLPRCHLSLVIVPCYSVSCCVSTQLVEVPTWGLALFVSFCIYLNCTFCCHNNLLLVNETIVLPYLSSACWVQSSINCDSYELTL